MMQEMNGVSIEDIDDSGVLSFDLRDILWVVGEGAIQSDWEVTSVEAVGTSAIELMQVAQERTRISGSRLALLAQKVDQTIDGKFAAFRRGESRPWLVVEAVDSGSFDVYTNEEDILRRLRERFSCVTQI